MGLGLEDTCTGGGQGALRQGNEVESGRRNTSPQNTQPLPLAQGHSGSVSCSGSSVRLHGACLLGSVASVSPSLPGLKEMLNFGEEKAEEGKEGKAGGPGEEEKAPQEGGQKSMVLYSGWWRWMRTRLGTG